MFTLTNLLLAMVLTGIWLAGAAVARSCCKSMKVNQPGMASMMLLSLMAIAGAVAAQFTLGAMMGMSLLGMSAEPSTAEQLRMMLAMPIWMLVCATIYRMMLPTTFGKAMCIFLAQAVVASAIMVGFSMLANITGHETLMQVREMLPL